MMNRSYSAVGSSLLRRLRVQCCVYAKTLSLAFAVVFFGVLAVVQAEEVKQKSLKVGVVLGLSGDAAKNSSNIRKGIELAAAELKAHGWEVGLRFEDDQTNAAKTVTAVQMLLSQGYKLFIGPTWDFQVNAIRGLVPKRDMVAIAPACSSAVNGGPIAGVFNLAPPREDALPNLVGWLRQHGIRRAFILIPNGSWGDVHRDLFRRAMEESGGGVVGNESFDYGIDGATSRVLILKAKAADADVIFTTGASGDSANLVRARNALGVKAAIVGTEDIQDALSTQLLTRDETRENVFALKVNTDSAASFKSKYRATYGEAPGFYADSGFDALMVLAQATETTDGTPLALRSTLLSGAELVGAGAPFRFDQHGDIKGGRFEIAQVE